MGKKEQRKAKGHGSKTYVLNVDMHCECTGCIKKITDRIKEISISEGIERADLVAETGEVIVVGMMNPERFCCILHEVTKKSVRIVTQSNLSKGRIVASENSKNQFRQAPSDWLSLEDRETSHGGWQDTLKPVTPSAPPLTPSAPPLPPETVPSERCWYRWPAPASRTLGVWAPSDVTVTLAMYEL